MNPQILKYVNFLLDKDPSPFCDYILCKEILKLDKKSIQDSYDWARQFQLYSELSKEQLSDGSWGGFDARISEQSKGRHFKTTAQAMHRMLDLSLDIDDPMVMRTVELCKRYLSGEVSIPDTVGKHNDSAPTIIRRSMIRWLSYFDPNDNYVRELRYSYAKRLTKACEKGYFDKEIWEQLDCKQEIAFYTYEAVYMLSYGDSISKDIQRIWLAYEWNQPLWYNPIKPSDSISPDQPEFHFWLTRLESLAYFSLFHEIIPKNIVQYLFSICDRLSDINEDIPIFINNYNYHYGQYTEPTRNKQQKKNDLLLRIIRILDRCIA